MNARKLVDDLLDDPSDPLSPYQRQSLRRRLARGKQEVGRAVQQWLDDDGDEADDKLLHSLLALGLITTMADTHVERGAREHGLVHVFIDDDKCLEIEPNGLSTIVQV